MLFFWWREVRGISNKYWKYRETSVKISSVGLQVWGLSMIQCKYTQYYYRKTEINLTKAVCYISISILYWFPCQFLVGPLLWRPWESHRGLTRSPEPEPEPKPHPHPTSLHLVFLCSASTRGLNRRLLIRLHQTGLHWSLRESYEISFSDWLAVGEDWEGMFIPQIN